ncbi:hypothetical protein QFC24_001038 [Naganishia onofrii]|uniref:Uncharacterized protein n=1 Tax=Naganishia onofrii TaxID=1851511 RepID=A0ACC2XUD0_9TREE|nr:hypothetical protein QFC24_001038 [Naganishia onofrii]
MLCLSVKMERAEGSGRQVVPQRRFDDLVTIFSHCEELKCQLDAVERKLRRFGALEKELAAAKTTIEDMKSAAAQQQQTAKETKRKADQKLGDARTLHQREVAKLKKTISDHERELQPKQATVSQDYRSLEEIRNAMVALQHKYQAGLNARKRLAAESLKAPPLLPDVAPVVKAPAPNKARPSSAVAIVSTSSELRFRENLLVKRAHPAFC